MRRQRGAILVSHCAALILASCGTAAPAPAPALESAPGDEAPAPVPVLESAPGDEALARPDDLVDITTLDGTIALDIRYATTNNFTGVAVYPVARCLLRRAVAERLVRVHRALTRRGMGVKLWDCYRPIRVQERFWQLVPDARYVARPVIERGVPRRGSRHNRGAAVDLTLVDAHGKELDMPTAYDDFSARAHRDSSRHTAARRRNMLILQRAMEAEGFTGLATEWWHFDGPNWQRYPLENRPLQGP